MTRSKGTPPTTPTFANRISSAPASGPAPPRLFCAMVPLAHAALMSRMAMFGAQKDASGEGGGVVGGGGDGRGGDGGGNEGEGGGAAGGGEARAAGQVPSTLELPANHMRCRPRAHGRRA